MTIIHAQWIGDQAVVSKQDFERLLELARRSEPVMVEQGNNLLIRDDVMHLAETGGAFDFWSRAEEDIYTGQDGEPV